MKRPSLEPLWAAYMFVSAAVLYSALAILVAFCLGNLQ